MRNSFCDMFTLEFLCSAAPDNLLCKSNNYFFFFLLLYLEADQWQQILCALLAPTFLVSSVWHWGKLGCLIVLMRFTFKLCAAYYLPVGSERDREKRLRYLVVTNKRKKGGKKSQLTTSINPPMKENLKSTISTLITFCSVMLSYFVFCAFLRLIRIVLNLDDWGNSELVTLESWYIPLLQSRIRMVKVHVYLEVHRLINKIFQKKVSALLTSKASIRSATYQLVLKCSSMGMNHTDN